ncbi:hypothetical protein SESBI_02225 [Sesbania bispinosa]|nr:hypothetical protein SESBI_02225 [Sesbania bispinosa]
MAPIRSTGFVDPGWDHGIAQDERKKKSNIYLVQHHWIWLKGLSEAAAPPPLQASHSLSLTCTAPFTTLHRRSRLHGLRSRLQECEVVGSNLSRSITQGNTPHSPETLTLTHTLLKRRKQSFSLNHSRTEALHCELLGKMRLLTHNMLSSNIKGVVNGFPLRIEAEKVVEKTVEMNGEFLKKMFEKIDWKAFVGASRAMGYTELPEEADSSMLDSDEFRNRFHHALLELHLEEGALVCPETGRRFPVTKGIPNMLLHEDEVLLMLFFDRLLSPHVANLIQGKKLDNKLVERLKIALCAAEALLIDAEQNQIGNPRVKNWLDNLRDAVYVADDLLDHFFTKAATQENPRENLSWRIPSTSLVKGSIYGREGDQDAIVKILNDNSEDKMSVIPIVGMGGVGKTTLAQWLYSNEDLI